VGAGVLAFGAFENPLRCALPRASIESDLKTIYEDWKEIAHRFRNQPSALPAACCECRESAVPSVVVVVSLRRHSGESEARPCRAR
jgi:hypothetical protein